VETTLEAVEFKETISVDEVVTVVRGDMLLESETVQDDCVEVKVMMLEEITVELADEGA
jgi:hypothetical protein